MRPLREPCPSHAAGTVYLIGAGPGDPGLLTLKGAEVLRRAHVVIYDRLAPAELLDLAPSGAERVYAGKAPGNNTLDQEGINAIVVDRARSGLTVARLKGGDPFVFGRGGEEAEALATAGIPFEVVPGLTSAIGAAAYAGIPVTHRDVSASVAIVTASRRTDSLEQIARIGAAVDTIVVLMAAGRLDEVCRTLIEHGRPPGEPAALVEWATTPRQRSLVSTLEALADNVDRGPGRHARMGPGLVPRGHRDQDRC
jgi:uroporphyrin-III C-methyltransferase